MRIEIGANEAGQRLDKFLRKYLKDVPLSAIYKSLRKGDVRVNDKKGKEKMQLEDGDVIEIKYMYSESPKKTKEKCTYKRRKNCEESFSRYKNG